MGEGALLVEARAALAACAQSKLPATPQRRQEPMEEAEVEDDEEESDEEELGEEAE